MLIFIHIYINVYIYLYMCDIYTQPICMYVCMYVYIKHTHTNTHARTHLCESESRRHHPTEAHRKQMWSEEKRTRMAGFGAGRSKS